MSKLVSTLIIFCAVFSAPLSAQGRWEYATNVGKEPTGDPMLMKCVYKTIGGYVFSIVVRGGGLCPYSVQVNPETGQVKQ